MLARLVRCEVGTVRVAACRLLRFFFFVVHTRQAELLSSNHQSFLVFVFYQATALNRGPRGPDPLKDPLRTRWPVGRCSSLDRVPPETAAADARGAVGGGAGRGGRGGGGVG